MHRFYKKLLSKLILGIGLFTCIYVVLWGGINAPQNRSVRSYSNRKGKFIESNQNEITYQDLMLNSNVKGNEKFCNVPTVVKYGQPWPYCAKEMEWLDKFWEGDSCYAQEGVNGTSCSYLDYLSTKEYLCPPSSEFSSNRSTVLKGDYLGPRSNFSLLLHEFSNIQDMTWIRQRISTMEKLWIKSAADIFSNKLRGNRLQKKRIHLHLGLMSIGLGESALNGGPLGELVQWSDLIASLYVMGHEIVVTRTKREIIFAYTEYIYNTQKNSCRVRSHKNAFPFDLIYTDINGYYMLERVLPKFDAIGCKIRVLDSFGTEASFNVAEKSSENDLLGLRLNLGQFNTMFPHTPDNTFLGFVVENPLLEEASFRKEKRNFALVYGKDTAFWLKSRKYLDIVREYVSEIHGTAIGDTTHLPPYVANHGILTTMELYKLLRRTKVFLGLGFPFEGPAPLEAIAMGAIFINPSFDKPINSDTHEFYKGKPTSRSIFSQNPYVEKYIGKPYVYTVNTTNESELRAVLRLISEKNEPKPYLPYEFSAKGMIERVAIQVEKQNFCEKTLFGAPWQDKDTVWPPTSSLKVTTAQSVNCNTACERKGLVCEPYFFPAINKKMVFGKLGLHCRYEHLPEMPRHIYPAYNVKEKSCIIQTHHLYFSCADFDDSEFVRLCPCREFVNGQVAMCEDCLG